MSHTCHTHVTHMPPQSLLYTSSRSDSDSFAQASEKELAFRVSQLRMEQVNPLTRFRCDTCFRRAVVYRMDLTRIHLTRIHLTRIPFDRLSRTSTRTLSSRKSSCRSSRATRSASSSSASTTSARPVSLSYALFDPHGTRICLARRSHPLYLCLTHIDIVVSHPYISPVHLTRVSQPYLSRTSHNPHCTPVFTTRILSILQRRERPRCPRRLCSSRRSSRRSRTRARAAHSVGVTNRR